MKNIITLLLKHGRYVQIAVFALDINAVVGSASK